MRIRYPSSFIQLLLIGFAFAVLPLLWAFANAYLAFDTLALIKNRLLLSYAMPRVQEKMCRFLVVLRKRIGL